MQTADRALVALLVVLASAPGCARSTSQTRPERGRVTVGVTTTGSEATSLTFRVAIEPAGIHGTVKADAGVFTRGDLPEGDHVVRLLDVPGRCRVAGGAERSIAISEQRRSAVVRFTVDCS